MRWARSAFIAAATAVVLLLVASPAQSGTITLEYDLTGSGVALLGGILNIPPDGSITSASVQVTVQGTSLTSASAGAAQLTNLILAVTVNGTVGSAVTVIGGFTGSQAGGGAGSLTAGLSNLIVGTISLNVNGLVNCFGGLCGALGTFPISAVNSLSVLPGPSNFGIGGLGTLGAATLNAILSMTIGGNSAVVSLVGQEVGRTFVPEPNSFALVGLGMLGLAGLGGRRARRR